MLPELLLAERENFVLKPNDEYGGKGVLLGWQTDPAPWAEAVLSGVGRGMIAQERCVPPTIRMPTFRNGLVYDDVYFDLCPFVFAGQMAGAMMRVSSCALTNVSAGGEVCGLLVVAEGARDV
jgi:hypothetical protein